MITTAKGGALTVDFTTGEYRYEIVVNKTIMGETEVFQVGAVDGDGDAISMNLNITLNYQHRLMPIGTPSLPMYKMVRQYPFRMLH